LQKGQFAGFYSFWSVKNAFIVIFVIFFSGIYGRVGRPGMQYAYLLPRHFPHVSAAVPWNVSHIRRS
jgi:hypothetical protein